MQECITLVVFCFFAMFYLGERIKCVLSASLPDLISRRRYRRPWLAGAARCFVGAVQTGRTFCKEDG